LKTQASTFLRDFVRLVKSTRNWYSIIPYLLGIGDAPIIKFKNGLKFYYVSGLFAVGTFLDCPYDEITFEGKTVVDIGAFNGDTAIYFSKRGARIIYAFEPFPAACSVARRNLELNGIKNVVLINCGLSSWNHAILIDPKYPSTGSSNLQSVPPGRFEVELKTLDQIVHEYGLVDAILKIDCEGCEYEVIQNTNAGTLRAFQTILVDTHGPRKPIIDSLESAGFNVRYGKRNAFLYATRID